MAFIGGAHWFGLHLSRRLGASRRPRGKPRLAARRARSRSQPAEITARSTPAIVTVRTSDGLGTGFVVRKDGWVATNFHVVRGATAVTVVFSDHREFEVVEIMNANRLHDLVILRIDAQEPARAAAWR